MFYNSHMTHIITGLCLRAGECTRVCPVACIHPGEPIDDWPWYYIDPEICIDCGLCIPACPYNAIWPEVEVPPTMRSDISLARSYFDRT
jgi:NAD-dependent dihydropyrimidine dehydrogenase PreA subunit